MERKKRETLSARRNISFIILELRDVGARLKRFFDELREHGASPERKEKHAALLAELTEILQHIGDAYSRQ